MKIDLVIIDCKNEKKFFRCYDKEDNMVVIFLTKAMKMTGTKVLATFDDKMMLATGNKLAGMEVELPEE